MTKSGREVMEILEAFDLTGTAWSAAQLAGCDAKTVARYVVVREAGGDPLARTSRPRLIDAFMDKVKELVDRSKGKIRAEIAHQKLVAMGYRRSCTVACGHLGNALIRPWTAGTRPGVATIMDAGPCGSRHIRHGDLRGHPPMDIVPADVLAGQLHVVAELMLVPEYLRQPPLQDVGGGVLRV